MQEDVEQKVVILIKSCSRLTAEELRKAMGKAYSAMKRRNANHERHGKTTVKKLAAQNRGMESAEVTDGTPASFSRVARKYGIDYAIYRVKGEDKFLVFFKAPDQAAMNAAFAEYTARRVKAASRPSVMKKLEQMQSRIIHTIKDRVRHKEPER